MKTKSILLTVLLVILLIITASIGFVSTDRNNQIIEKPNDVVIHENYELASIYQSSGPYNNRYYWNYDDKWYVIEPIASPEFYDHLDQESFEIIDGAWARDKNGIYYHGRVLEGVSPEGFGFIEVEKTKTKYYSEESRTEPQKTAVFGLYNGNIYDGSKPIPLGTDDLKIEIGYMGQVLTNGMEIGI
jgi:hypothetical protein